MRDTIDFSGHGTPAYCERFFSAATPRFVVEIGAADGVSRSDAREFILRGWRGLLTESSPALFEQLRDAYSGLEGVTCLNVTCVPGEGTPLTELLRTAGCPPFFALLALGPGQPAAQILSGLDQGLFQPTVLIVPDDGGDAATYHHLIERGFRYCATIAGESIWMHASAEAPSPATRTPSPAPPFTSATATPPAPVPLPIPAYTIEQPAVPPGEVLRIVWGGSLRMQGWAFVPPADTKPAVEIEFVQMKTRWAHRVPTARSSRADVALHFGNPALRFGGFHADISFRGWEPGVYSVSLLLVEAGVPVAGLSAFLQIELTLHEYEIAARAGLAAKFLSGSGIEIGALQRRLPVLSSCRVKYIDRMPIEQLVAHYPELGTLPLQSPDFIDDGELLTGIADGSQDFVIANHFFEHSLNPIQTLLNFARVLTPGGVLFMAVPDKRYTRDVLRPETPFPDLLETYVTGLRKDTARMYREWAQQWEGAVGEEATAAHARHLEATNYSIHHNVWSLSGLLEFLLGAQREARVPFEITAAVSSENEVILILTRLR